ncbi:NAD(P)H-dependent oxidoreductase [Paraburkholderia sp.]|uniref:FMN-dependent NADH-azoreductase n=1 Tax=Paraburkholderia sp. TaxID=1926495 RepID=UPI0023A1AAB4|nr:NAD(P)H-dependent oxidoreductase [Paraburkholderia sp.]MDE1179800.1 NAD(P)H-dependent oxidoreductase [Paraburkholderia sp.]
MKLFHVDSSAKREHSNSRALSRQFIDTLRRQGVDVEVDYLDVTVDTPAHVTEAFAIATYRAESERTADMKTTLAASDALCRRLLEADALLFAMPMYNWSMPSVFKAFIDNVTRTGLTYKYSADGQIIGQLSRQKVLFLTTRGADLRAGSPFASMDALTPALKASFGFIGVGEPTFVDAQPLQFSDPQSRAEALVRAQHELADVAAQWAVWERERIAGKELIDA